MSEKTSEKHAGGRPTVYNKRMCKIAYGFAALHLTDREIAEKMGIAESTLTLWKKNYPEFSASIHAGKEALNDNVEKSLYELATGYEKEVERVTKDGDIVTVKEYYPPQTRACEFYLMNRRRKEWTNRQEIVNTNLNVEVPVTEEQKAKIKENMQAMFPGLKIV
jgi:transcriptional regulator with XRE-family HTH domain